jgi:hypothetical protein
MPWLLTKTNFGRRFTWQSITSALAAVTGGTQARAGNSSGLYTDITGLWGFTPPAPPPATTGTAITYTTGGLGTASVTLTFTGGPAPAHRSITFIVGTASDSSGGRLSIQKGMTASQAAIAAAAALDGKPGAGKTITLAATATGSVVTLTEVRGALITSLTP